MRKDLRKLEGTRQRFSGVFVCYGSRPGYRSANPRPTVLIRKIQTEPNGKHVTDHAWFDLTKGFRKLGELSEGDRIAFDARVRPYVKGYVNYRRGIDDRRVDYRLSHPSKVQRL